MRRPVLKIGRFIGLLGALLVIGLIPVIAQEAQETEEVVTTREAAPDPAAVTLEPLVSGFDFPLYATGAGDGSGRLFVVEQSGRIYIVRDGARVETPFIDLSDRVTQSVLRGYSEAGLLGLTFHPNFADNGYFYVNYTDADLVTHITRFTVSADNPDVADKATAQDLLTLAQPYANHNGGQLAFGPDGYLYIAVGDGGAANDPLNTGQDPSDWFGSILRLDVDNGSPYAIPADNPVASNDTFAPEVWAYGLRNPWRFSFDRATGDLYIADVGQNQWEEVNFEPADSPGGVNYGWSNYEASQPFSTSQVPEGMVYPFAEYSHANGDCSVTGGYLYRGEAVPELAGVYLFSDYCTGRIWTSYRTADGNWQTNLFKETSRQVSSLAQDDAGELYVIDYSGVILQIRSAS